jgi:hypothetical protein
LPLLLASHIASGDEITFPIPDGDTVGAEVYIPKSPSLRARNCFYLGPVGYITQPKLDKRNRSFVSARVRGGNLGVSSVVLPCKAVSAYFYAIGVSRNGSDSDTLYKTLRVVATASHGEIRIAFKLRALELKANGVERVEYVKLERAFNLLGNPQLRAHYESLLANPEIPAIFPYGGVGSILVAGDRFPQRRDKKRGSDWKFVDWETGLPSRLSVKFPTDCERDIEKARTMYCRFGQYPCALDQLRLCLEHKAIERKELERICSELGIPAEFDIAQISWRPDYDPFFYRELSRPARRIYLFRDEYIFDCEKAVVVETPQLGHATCMFARPRDMDNFLTRYTKTTKTDIRRNHENIADQLGFVCRVVHGSSPRSWLKELQAQFGERHENAAAS